MTWAPDAQLTPLGHSQAATARRAWQTEIRNGIMIPQIFYVSPMRRALETWTDTFGITGNDAILSNEHRKVTILEVSYAILGCNRLSKLTLHPRTAARHMEFILVTSACLSHC